MPRIELVEYLWDQQVFIDDNALSVNITRLRAKLAEIGVCDFIETKEGWAIAYETDRISERQGVATAFTYGMHGWACHLLRLTGYSMDKCVIILVCYGVILAGWLFLQFFHAEAISEN